MATEEIEISELEFTEELASDNLIPVESTTDTKATSLQILKNWLSSFFVGKTDNNIISGINTFSGKNYFYNSSISQLNPTFTKGNTNVSSDVGFATMQYTDKDLNPMIADYNYIRKLDGKTSYVKRLYKNEAGTTGYRDCINAYYGSPDGLTLDLRANDGGVLLPSVASNEESNKGATTKFVRDLIASGNTSGSERFIQIPIKGQQSGQDKVKIQWGHIEKGVTTITFPTPFVSTNITVCPIAYYNSSSQVAFYDITTTGCKIYPNRSDYVVKWLAIGY